MPPIWEAISLDEPPPSSTLCKTSDCLDMAVWCILLNLSSTLLSTNGIVGIDAYEFNWSHASKPYTKRTKLTIQQLKLTLLLYMRPNAILDIHVTTTRKYDSQTTPSLIKQNDKNIGILLDDKRYDRQRVRAVPHDAGVRPLTKHREFSSVDKA